MKSDRHTHGEEFVCLIAIAIVGACREWLCGAMLKIRHRIPNWMSADDDEMMNNQSDYTGSGCTNVNVMICVWCIIGGTASASA